MLILFLVELGGKVGLPKTQFMKWRNHGIPSFTAKMASIAAKAMLSSDSNHDGRFWEGEREFKEIEGDREGSKFYETGDHHIYRRNKANSPYLSCYFSSITQVMLKTSPNAIKCQGKKTGTAVISLTKILFHK